MHKVPVDAEASKGALAFVDWAYRTGGGMALELDYIPLPEGVVERVREAWKSIKDPAGNLLFGG
jgi:phosphate transport system substrate-binding protein